MTGPACSDDQAFENQLALEHAALVGRLAAGISHDLNNPLAAILGFAQAIRIDLDRGEALTPDSLRGDLETIEQQAVRASDLVRDLLELARPFRAVANAAPTRLEPVVRQAMRLVDYAAQRVQSTLDLEVDERGESIAAMVDVGRLRHLLVELMHEAILATDRGAVRVEIEADAAAQQALVRFVASPASSCVSEPGDKAVVIARELAGRMGGAIQVDQPESGVATFTLCLPGAS